MSNHTRGASTRIRDGRIEGYVDKEKRVVVWKGIPFAAPPVAERRWMAPADPQPWAHVLQAQRDPAPCSQLIYEPTWLRQPIVHGSEDCLYLNVYRPWTDEVDLPVLFWIHGGANSSGYAAEYDMSNFARKANAVVVVPQYRLNAFGFFTHAALRAQVDRESASGNYGALDQIKALRWTRDNVAEFGGNPDNVCIAGESAGAHNVSALLISPLSRGLFHKAMMESGFMRWDSVAQADAISERTFAAACVIKGEPRPRDPATIKRFLQGLSAEQLVQAHAGGIGQTMLPLGNQIEDGYVVPESLLTAFAAGRYSRVPIMVGANANETGLTSPLLPPLYDGMPDYRDLNEVVYGRKSLHDVLPTEVDRELYRKANFYGSLFWRTAHTDEFSRRLAQHQDVYAYCFQWGDEKSRPGDIGFIYGAAHATEIAFFHGNVDDEESNSALPWAIYNGLTPENRAGRKQLSGAMVQYTAQFMRTGAPSGEPSSLPVWRPWSNVPAGAKYLALDANQQSAIIQMQNDQNSMAGIWAMLDAEPPDHREHILKVVYAIQGFYVSRDRAEDW